MYQQNPNEENSPLVLIIFKNGDYTVQRQHLVGKLIPSEDYDRMIVLKSESELLLGKACVIADEAYKLFQRFRWYYIIIGAIDGVPSLVDDYIKQVEDKCLSQVGDVKPDINLSKYKQ